MKALTLIFTVFFLLYVIHNDSVEGFLLRRNCNSNKIEQSKQGGKVGVSSDSLNCTEDISIPKMKFTCPIKKFRLKKVSNCECKLIPCECRTKDETYPQKISPEVWFTKTSWRKHQKPPKIRQCFLNSKLHHLDCCEELESLKKKYPKLVKEVEKVQGQRIYSEDRQAPEKQHKISDVCNKSPVVNVKSVDMCAICERCEIQKGKQNDTVFLRCIKCHPSGKNELSNRNPGKNIIKDGGRCHINIKTRYFELSNENQNRSSSLANKLKQNGIQV